jgi:hypothetical protein
MERAKLSIEDIDAIVRHEMTQRLGYDAKDHVPRIGAPSGAVHTVPRCECLSGNSPLVLLQRHINNCDNGKQSLVRVQARRKTSDE